MSIEREIMSQTGIEDMKMKRNQQTGIVRRSTLRGALALLLAGSCFGAGAAAAGALGTSGTGTAPAFVYSPYKDATISMNWNTNVISTNVTGQLAGAVGAAYRCPYDDARVRDR